MKPAAGAAVVTREAVRASRRWQTYALRFGFGLLLFVLVLWAWANRVQTLLDDPAAAARLGNLLFKLYGGAQLMMVAVIAPVVVGQAIAEEREDGTLELLTLTRLSSTQILWSKVVSRLLIIASIVLSSLPVLSLVLTFGGVGVWEAINAVSVTLLLIVLLGAVGGFAALTDRGGVASLLSATGYAFFVLGVTPAFLNATHAFMAGRRRIDSPDWSLVAQAFQSDHASALLIWVVCLPGLLGLSWLAAPVFQMATTSDIDDDFGMLSPEIWKVERFKRYTFLVGVAWMFFAILMILLSRRIPDSVWLVLRIGQTAGLVFIATVLWAFAFEAAARFASRMLRSESREERFEGGGFGRRLTTALRARVWANPVAWREVVTRGQGPGSVIGRLGVPVMLVLAVPVLVLARFDDDMFVLLGGAVAAAGLVATGLAAGGSFVPDRRLHALELLSTTTLSPGAVVRGKFLAIAAHGLPLFALGLGLVALGTVGPFGYHYPIHADDLGLVCRGGAHFSSASQLWPKVLVGGVWGVAAWSSAATVAMAVAFRVRPSSMGWGASLLAALVWLPGPVLLLMVTLGRGGRDWAQLWIPMDLSWNKLACTPSSAWAYAIATHLVIAVLGLALIRWRLRAWVVEA